MKNRDFLLLCGLALCLGSGAGRCNAGSDDIGNPLLLPFDTPFGVPPFERIAPEHFVPAFEAAMARHDEEVRQIAESTDPPTYANTVQAYLASGELLNTITSIFDNTTGANTSDALQKISAEINPRLSAHRDALTLNPRLFARIKAVHDARDREQLGAAETYLLERLYQSFVLNGALLPAAEQGKLKAINQELAGLAVTFDNNVLAQTNAYRLVVERKEDLAGLPDAVVATAAETAARDSLPGKWVFTTHKPSMIPFLQYARNRALREQLYTAYTNRANHDDASDNKAVLARIVELRADKAGLLGFPNYAAYKLQTSMAGTPEKAFALLDDLWDRSLIAARREAAELQALVDQEGGGFQLASWDWWYYAEKLRKAKYDLDESEIRPYFRLENVRDGLFTVAGRLYGLTFAPLPGIPVPHPDAQAYEVQEADGSHLGVLYLDYYPRESKEGGAWCLEYRGHHVVDGQEITPVTTVVCNLTRPTQDAPALLSMDDTETLFHEFGHAVESLTSRVPHIRSYVATDFVELPSQLMEHWAFRPEVLRLYARHYQTGAVIPEDLIARIRKAALFNQGFATTEYLAASLLDLGYHSLAPGTKVDVAQFERDFFARRGLIPEIVPRYRSTYFGHITGGYDAGYYSYIWSAVLDDDAFGAFDRNGVFDRATATSFRQNILERDGTADPMVMFKSFMGREPSVEPLLRERGLI